MPMNYASGPYSINFRRLSGGRWLARILKPESDGVAVVYKRVFEGRKAGLQAEEDVKAFLAGLPVERVAPEADYYSRELDRLRGLD